MLCGVLVHCFGCHYRCNRLHGKSTRLRNELLICIEWDVKSYTVDTHSLTWSNTGMRWRYTCSWYPIITEAVSAYQEITGPSGPAMSFMRVRDQRELRDVCWHCMTGRVRRLITRLIVYSEGEFLLIFCSRTTTMGNWRHRGIGLRRNSVTLRLFLCDRIIWYGIKSGVINNVKNICLIFVLLFC